MEKLINTLNKLFVNFHNHNSNENYITEQSNLQSLKNIIDQVLLELSFQLKNDRHLLMIISDFFKLKFVVPFERGEPIPANDYHYTEMIARDLQHYLFPTFAEPFPLNIQELLIYWNLNSWQVITYLHAAKINLLSGATTEKLSLYRQWLNNLKRIPKQEAYRFQALLPDLHDYLKGRLLADMRELQVTGLGSSIGQPKDSAGINRAIKDKNKVRINMSSDQIGILLRVFYEKGILLTKSVRLLFRLIIPFLSTGTKEVLSWDSVRKRVYPPEQSDIIAVQKMLRDMADYLEEY